MRDDGSVLRAALKSRLMAGVAGLAAVAASSAAWAGDSAPAPASATPQADPPKWQPYADLGLGVGDSLTSERLDMFVPIRQDTDSLLFISAGLGHETHYSENASIGLGYRTKIDPDWILGGYAAFDNTHTDFSHSFEQFAIGAEVMSEDWDARINGYLAADRVSPIKNKFELSIIGNTIEILQGQEASYSGFDGEVGYRIFGTDDTDVRVYAGGFSFTRSGYSDISGPKGRVEVNVFDLDEFGAQSRLSIQGQISHDDVRGTDAFVGATLRIPLDSVLGGSAAQTLDEIDRRMADPVRRNDNVLTQWAFNKPEPVIVYGQHFRSQPTNTLLYVDNSAGAGTLSYATSFSDATKRGAADNAFIVGTSYQGTIKTHGVHVASGETVAGGGETLTVKGANSGATFTHTFAPGSKTPTFTSGSATQNVFNLGSNTAIYGLTIKGPFHDAIYGHNASNVTVGNVSIDGSAGGYDGISLVQDKSQDSNISIDHVTIHNLTGDGIHIPTTTSDGGSSTLGINIADAHISNVLDDGIDITSNVSGGSSIDQTIGIHDSSVRNSYFYGIFINGAAGHGTISQNITIDPTVVSTSGGGLLIGASATGGGSVSQTATVSYFTASHNFGDGVYIAAYAVNGHVDQNVTLKNVTASSNLLDGIDVNAFAGSGGEIDQHLLAIGVTANHNGFEYCTPSGCLLLGGNGLIVNGSAFSTGAGDAVVAQYITAAYGQFDHNVYAGIAAVTYALGDTAAAKQNLYVVNSSMQHNGGPAVYYPSYGAGVLAESFAFVGGSTQQYVVLGKDTIANNRTDGAVFIAYADYDGFAAQHAVIYGTAAQPAEVSGNQGQGIWLGAYAVNAGAVEQNAGIYYVDASNNTGDGIRIVSYAASGVVGSYTNYYSHVAQNIVAAFDTASGNGGDGISIQNTVTFGGAVDQFVGIYYISLTGNVGDGIHERSVVSAYYPGTVYALQTQLNSGLYVIGAHADQNKGDGVAVDSYGYGPVYMIDHALVYGSTASHNGGNGFESRTYAAGIYGLNIQYLTLANSKFGHNKDNGAYFTDIQYYGPGSFGAAIQEITVGNSDFSHNKQNGLEAVAYAHGNQGRAEQNLSIGYSTFNDNKGDGIFLSRIAANGVYVAGYDCTEVQGLYGGCAFVRQVVQIGDSQANGNGQNGIEVDSYASNFGAIYTAAGRTEEPTLLLKDVTADYNGQTGFYSSNRATNGSYVYNYAVLINSHFDNNYNGVYVGSIATLESAALQKAVVYSYNGSNSSASNNARYGLLFRTTGDAGSYAASQDLVLGTASGRGQFNDNGYLGIGVIAYGALNLTAIYNNDVGHNGYFGIGLASFFSGQYAYVGGNTISHNPVGLIANAYAALQVVNLYYYHGDPSKPMGNTFSHNGSDTEFNSAGGALQIIY